MTTNADLHISLKELGVSIDKSNKYKAELEAAVRAACLAIEVRDPSLCKEWLLKYKHLAKG